MRLGMDMRLSSTLVVQVLDFVAESNLKVGGRLSAQSLATRLRVSRTPVNAALEQLSEQGVLRWERNRGYILAQPIDLQSSALSAAREAVERDRITQAYLQIAEDRLQSELGDEFSDLEIRQRYALTPNQTSAVLARICQEGWIQERAGHGWKFCSMLTTPDELMQSYRLRLALEPAALLEPGYRMPREVLEQCRAAEIRMLHQGVDVDTADQIHARGVSFHEALVAGSKNPLFVDVIRQVNAVRRLLSYRSTKDRNRYKEHCHQHLNILDLLEQGENAKASESLALHLRRNLFSIQKIHVVPQMS
jgi:DNA-binding GntR family transcriptional regulator